MNTTKNIILIFIISLFTGCTTFSKRDFKKDYTKLNKENVTQLSGKYTFYPSKGYGKECSDIVADPHIHVNLFQEITNKNMLSAQCIDSVKGKQSCCIVELKLIDPNQLQVLIKKDSTVIDYVTLNGKLKNKMFLIDNKELTRKGIPYLWGSYFNSKRRIGLSKSNNLIVNEVIGKESTIMIFATSGYNIESAFEFKRVE